MSLPQPSNEREYARIDVDLPVRFKILEAEEAAALQEILEEKATVWAPSHEKVLLDMATAGTSDREAMLAQAVLDLSEQIVKLRSHLVNSAGPMQSGAVQELSGGGGRLATKLLLEQDTLLDLSLLSGDEDCPPIRIIARIVHRNSSPPSDYGFKFEVINPQDHDRIIRYIYQIQRRALRKNLDDEPEL